MQELIKLAIEKSSDAVVIFTNHFDSGVIDPKIVYANEMFLEEYGVHLADIIGQSPCNFFGKHTDMDLVERIKNTLIKKKNWQSPLTVYNKTTGEGIDSYIRIIPVKNAIEDTMYYACFLESMDRMVEEECSTSACKHLEGFVESVFETSGYFNEIFNNVPHGLWRMNSNGDLLFTNQNTMTHFGLKPEDNLFDYIHYEERKSIRNIFNSCQPNQQLNHLIFRLKDQNKIMWVNIQYWPVVRDDKVIGFSGTIRDVTKETLLVKQLEALRG